MKPTRLTRLAVATAFIATLPAAGAQKLEDMFPPQVEIQIKKKELEPEKRQHLKSLGISDAALDLYGDLHVNNYGATHMRWGDLRPDDLGPTPVTEYDTTGMRKLKPLPPPGVHPRLLFQESDRAAHLERLQNTRGGKEAMKALTAMTEFLKGRYDPEADYAKPDILKGFFGTRGYLELFRYGYSDGWDAYSQGKTSGIPTIGKKDKEKKLAISPGLLALEAYRCWLFNDADGARKVATATETYLNEVLSGLEPGKKPEVRGGLFNLNYIYDILYNWLTEDQRKLFRGVIIANMHDTNQYGMFQNAINTTSNWSTFGYQYFSGQGIQGDPGDHQLHYAGFLRTMKNYFTYGWFKGGTCFEAFGKNQMGGDILYGMALRGDNIVAHPHILACVREYLPHAILPWGGEYIAYDRWGGVKKLNPTDILPIKNLFPDDKRIDWVYRNTVGKDYDWMHRMAAEGWGNFILKSVVFADDYMPDNDDPGKLMGTESFVDKQRGLMITRSDWGPDALYMQMHTRGFSGGHVFADRSSIVLAGLGRMWIPNGALSYRTRENSVVSVDDREVSNYNPARFAKYESSPLATFGTADLRPTWNYTYTRLSPYGNIPEEQKDQTVFQLAEGADRESWGSGRAVVEPFEFRIPDGWEKVTECFNDMSLEKEDKPQFTVSQWAKPHWLEPGKITSLIRQKNPLEFVKAFRTAGMVRGANPAHSYVMVIDDWKASDDEFHTYDWLARVSPDLDLIQVLTYDATDGKYVNRLPVGHVGCTDALLASVDDIQEVNRGSGRYAPKLKKGSKALLVRILQMDAPNRAGEFAQGIDQPAGAPFSLIKNSDNMENALQIRGISKNPNFKILLYPTITADLNNNLVAAPKTIWDADKRKLAITIGDQTDTFDFKESPDGATSFSLKRSVGGAEAGAFDYDLQKGTASMLPAKGQPVAMQGVK